MPGLELIGGSFSESDSIDTSESGDAGDSVVSLYEPYLFLELGRQENKCHV